MLYIITKAMAEDLSVPLLGDDHKSHLDLLNNEKTRFIEIQDYSSFLKILAFFNLSHKLVVSHPDLPDPDGALLADKEHIIDWKSFEKEAGLAKQPDPLEDFSSDVENYLGDVNDDV